MQDERSDQLAAAVGAYQMEVETAALVSHLLNLNPVYDVCPVGVVVENGSQVAVGGVGSSLLYAIYSRTWPLQVL